MKKKIAFVILIGSLVFSYFGCSSPGNNSLAPVTTDTTFMPLLRTMKDTAVAINDSVSLKVTDTNPKSKLDICAWSLDNDTGWTTRPAANDSTGTFTKGWNRSQTGLHIVKVKCHNTNSQWSRVASFNVNVKLFPPYIKTPAPDTVTVGILDTVELHCTAADTNGTIVKYCWQNLRENRTDTTMTGTLRTVFANAGSYTMVVKAFDDDTIPSNADTFTVIANVLPPKVQSQGDMSARLHDSVLVVVNGSASSGRTIKQYLWTVIAPRRYDTTIASQCKFAFADTGTHLITTVAVDDHGIVSQPCTTRVQIGTVVPIVVVNGGRTDTTIAAGTPTLDLKAVVTNAADDPIAEYAWLFPGSVTWKVVSKADTTVTLPATAGIYKYQFRAKDVNGFYGYGTLNVTIKSTESLWDMFKWDVDNWQ